MSEQKRWVYSAGEVVIEAIQQLERPEHARNQPLIADTIESSDEELTARIRYLRRMDYQDYLLTKEWRARRKDHLTTAGHRCEECGRSREILYQEGGLLHVHHLTYEHLGEERPEELRVLCDRCHARAHGKADTHFLDLE